MHPRRQPLLGIIVTLAIIVISLAFISVLDWGVLRDWVSFYLMCAIPFAFVAGAFWQGEHPRQITRLTQPLRGLSMLCLAAIVAVVVGTVLLFTVGGGVTPPTPMAAQCVIISVPISFALTVVFGGWPFRRLRSPIAGGIAILVSTYAIAALVFESLMNFSWISQAPFYSPGLDPQGPFDSWTVLVFIVTAMAGAFLLLHFDLWPLTNSKRAMEQPRLGFAWAGIALAVAAAATYLGLNVLGMPAPEYLVTVPVPFLFGSIVLLVILEASHVRGMRQPGRGLVSALAAALLGVALAKAFAAVSGMVSGDLQWGAPSFDGQVWLASALLAVTFPFLSFHKDFFGMWPLASTSDDDAATPAPPS